MNLGHEASRVLVTGASRGIGLGIAEAFLAEGARVAIGARTAEPLESATAALRERFGPDRVAAVRADFCGGDDEIARALSDARNGIGGLNIIIANVGSGRGAPGLDADTAEWERLVRLNLLGAASLARLAVPMLGEGSSLVFISSIAGLESLAAPLPYSAAKAALIALAANLARQLGPRGIRVNTVSPGNVLHPGGSWAVRREHDPEGTDQYVRAEVPLARFGTPADIGAAVVFLASSQAAGFITGANLVVDGGQSRSF